MSGRVSRFVRVWDVDLLVSSVETVLEVLFELLLGARLSKAFTVFCCERCGEHCVA